MTTPAMTAESVSSVAPAQPGRRAPAWRRRLGLLAFALTAGLALPPATAQQEEAGGGGISGVVIDDDFDAPIPGVRLAIIELNRSIESGADGHFLFSGLNPGAYTLTIDKEGYRREVRSNVAVAANQLNELEIRLVGEYTEMEALIVEEIDLTQEAAVGALPLDPQNAAVAATISSELIGKAGHSTVAGALSMVSGATVSEGKYAVIRGLGDRYTSTQINGVRLPSADPEKRAVQLDLFPSALVDAIRVSKVFTPDQQGDAGGGAINIVTRAIPEESIYAFKIAQGHRSGTTKDGNFLWNERRISDYWGRQPQRALDRRSTEVPAITRDGSFPGSGGDLDGVVSDREREADRLINGLTPVVGPTRRAPPADHSWSVTVGDFLAFTNSDWRVGGLLGLAYSRKYSSYTGALRQTVSDPTDDADPLDVQSASREDQGVEKILWGRIATLGLDLNGEQRLGVTHLYTHATDNQTAQRVYDLPVEDKPWSVNNARIENTLDYTERTMESLQTFGRHTLPFLGGWQLAGTLDMEDPIFSWTGARSQSRLFEPDRTRSGGTRTNDVDGTIRWADPLCYRDWYDINERSSQFFWDGTLPFVTPSGEKGKLQFGHFLDQVTRTFRSDYLTYAYPTYAYGREVDKYAPIENLTYRGGVPEQVEEGETPIWETLYGQNRGLLPQAQHPDYPDLFGISMTSGTFFDQPAIDYDGEQTLRSSYWMVDVPFRSWLSAMFGTRVEQTRMSTRVDVLSTDESDPLLNTLYLYRLERDPVSGQRLLRRTPVDEDEANSQIDETDVLPAFGLTFKPDPTVVASFNWSRTIARPTFKELAPVATPIHGTQDAFIGNPDLVVSHMENSDLRLEWMPRPRHSDLFSLSFFHKDIQDVIDRDLVDRGVISGETVTFPVNYPEARITGFEFEWRQGLDAVADWAAGWTLTYNYTRLASRLTYDADKIESLAAFSGATSRPLQSQPDDLANVGLIFEDDRLDVDISLFYRYTGGMLVAGESASFEGGYTPSIYQRPSSSLTLSLSKRIFGHLTFGLTMNMPLERTVEQVYRSGDREDVRSSVPTSADYSLSLGGTF